MPGPFDTTLNYLIQSYPADWISFLGLAMPERIEVIEAKLSVVSAEVDNVVRLGDDESWLLHVEFQSGYDETIGRRLLRYNATLHLQYEDPVESVLVLLRPTADGPAVSGEYQLAVPRRESYLTFRYAVRRIWQEPAADLLRGALGTLPLAPLGAASHDELPGLLRTVSDRFTAEAPPAEAARLQVVTYTLLGLRYPPTAADQLMPGIRNVRDSLTYQAIVEEGRIEGRVEGRAEEARELLLELGERRFGPPDERIRAALAAVGDHARLHALVTHVYEVASWDDLLSR